MRVKITLACTECKQRNYNMTKEKKNHPDRMETKKYCRFCRKHGLQLHQVAVEPLLDKIGIEYRPEDKYKGINKKDLMRPELPGVLKCC